MDICIMGIKTFIKKKSLFEGGKKREQRVCFDDVFKLQFALIESFLNLILNSVKNHPAIRSCKWILIVII